MVDYHMRKQISPETIVEGDISIRVWSSTIKPSTEGNMSFFIILNDLILVVYLRIECILLKFH